jgi:hypothetical protein
MALSNLTSTQLERLVELIKARESLQAKLERVNQSLNELDGGEVGNRQTAPEGRRKRRGKLKDGILKLLGATGKQGLSVKEIAEKLKAKPASVSVWFYSAGKKIKGITKLGAGRYSYAEA